MPNWLIRAYGRRLYFAQASRSPLNIYFGSDKIPHVKLMDYKTTKTYYFDFQTIFEIIKDVTATITLVKYLYEFIKRARPYFYVPMKLARHLGRFVYSIECLDDGSNDYLGDCCWRASHSTVEAKVFFSVFTLLSRKDWESEYDYFNSSTKESKSMSILVKSPFVALADFNYTYPCLPKCLSRLPVQLAFRKT